MDDTQSGAVSVCQYGHVIVGFALPVRQHWHLDICFL